MLDLIIIGAGPAGITASIYAARKQINFLVISKDIGGQATISSNVENYTGYQEISGEELVKKFEEHMKKFNIKFKAEEVMNIKKINKKFKVKTNKAFYEAKAVLVATGAKPRELKIPGEKEFKNKGTSYCVTCDGPLFSGKDVAIIGGGDSALDAALQLIKIANKVYIININKKLGGEEIRREKIEKSKKVRIINNANTKEILGNKIVTGLVYEKDGEKKKLSVQGIFIEIGYIPNSELVKDLVKLNKKGEIIIDKQNRTNVEGLFAAGDVTDIPEKQIIIAGGEGSKALLSIYNYLSGLR